MIKELRIGNLVLDTERNLNDYITGIEIERVSLKFSLLPYTPINLIKPIPLTEEWLEKFKAKYYIGTVDCYYISIPNLKSELHFEIHGKEIVTILKGNFCDLILDELKYVHKLQNLYFALTGEELTIKE